ncbi:flagellar biosynthesis protein FlhA [Algisphaera agarilytica]|uniref:Flagellar biosynthesis protein FlhA n=1 Tax=Algisphaera agarilytica TaxID=1385975 RepID=A0A7X0LLL3_9BACT|nr:flagellar biosynthesis protein FlhA [Algisphaera agarilytica]MBB6430756.1 flagellar biosynthesis protein FlhA [Algisphaera agarilytica]
MAQVTSSPLPAWLNRLDRYRPLLVPGAVIGLIAVIVVPLPPFLMDMLIATNIALAALILMTTIFVKSPLEFSVFPALLLGTTLFRLVLNIATTRLILAADVNSPSEATAVAGKVIEAFSEFVSGSSIVVGAILFIILIIVQFVVITKGATRISEVAARFTLDAMPGKQMAIDADLNAGIIDEGTARQRREDIGREADFYGAMDGAAKFVRGDAIAGIIITIVNIIGGFAVGIAMKGWSAGESMDVFTKLTIGDGLVSQLPAFVVSIGAALIVTRSGSRRDFGEELSEQLASRGAALGITAAFLAAMAFTGLPTVPMMALALVCGVMAFFASRNRSAQAAAEADEQKKQDAAKDEPPPIEQALGVDTLELEVGYGLVRMVDTKQGGDLLDRITMIRRQLAAEQGFVMPPVRIRDNMQHQPNDYHFKIRGNSVAQGQVYPGQFLAMDGGLASPDNGELKGVRVKEPAFGLNAVWIDAGQKQRAESLNYTVVDATSVLATHLTEVVKNFADELLDFEETNNLITQLKEKAPKLTEAVLEGDPPLVKPSDLQKVLQNLLGERVPVRDLATIVETLGEWAPRTKDLDVLTEYVRNALRRTVCSQYTVQEADTNDPGMQGPGITKLYCVSLDPALEDQILGYIDRSAEGTSMSMPPVVANRITAAIIEEVQRLIGAGHNPVVLASPQVRAQVRSLIEPHLPTCAVLGYNEISKGVEVESLGLIQSSAETPNPSEPPLTAPGPVDAPSLQGASR